MTGRNIRVMINMATIRPLRVEKYDRIPNPNTS